MNLDFNFEENDFFAAIGITEDDKATFTLFQQAYYSELSKKLYDKKIKEKLNPFQVKKYALELSSHSKMLHAGLEWFKDAKRKDELIVLTLGDIFFKISTSDIMQSQFKNLKNFKSKIRSVN